MCGLTAILNFDGQPVDIGCLTSMTKAIRHRGPDSDGTFTDGPVGLGHRRLSIIDLSASGNQPMESPDGRYVIAYNGEIYNYPELRSEMETRGEQFTSTSDTAVLLRALKVYGIGCLNRLNGMFAFVLWDRWEKRLILARDRYGIKPLYYAHLGNSLIVASEVKALLAHRDLSTDINPTGLAEYVAFQNFFGEQTLFKNIYMFPRASYAVLKLGQSRELDPIAYWDFEFSEPESHRDEQDYLEEGMQLFRRAVRRQLVSDVAVGSYLSGGLDSGSITSLAAEQLPNIRTFTCGFDLNSASGMELNYDERASAEELSYLCGTEHYEVVLKSGDMERVMPQLAYHLEEPRVGQSYPNFYVARLASRFVKVVLSGAGGDEIFGGYPWRYYRAINGAHNGSFAEHYYDFWQRLVPQDQYRNFLRPIHSEISDFSPRDTFSAVLPDSATRITRPEEAVNTCLYFEACTFLHGLLTVEDKISMAHGLETRVPFLDNDLVDFAQRLPVSLKLRDLKKAIQVNENEIGKADRYFRETRDGKMLLRHIAEGVLPQGYTNRPKQGFSAPDASWFKGQSIDFVRERIMTPDAKIYQFIDYDVASSLVNDHLEGRANRRLLVWSLLNLEEWCNVFT